MRVNFAIAVVLMALTGLIDSQVFSRAPLIWKLQGLPKFLEILKVVLIGALGWVTYITSTYFLHLVGVHNALIIVMVWFIVTVIGVAFVSGAFFSLSTLDKIIAVMAIILVGLLYYRGVASD